MWVVPIGQTIQVMIPYHMLRRGKVPTATNTQRTHYKDLSDSETDDDDTSPEPVQKSRKLRAETEDLPQDPPSRDSGPARHASPASRPQPNVVPVQAVVRQRNVVPVAARARPAVSTTDTRELTTPLVTPVRAVVREPDGMLFVCFLLFFLYVQ
jgi:hypothetical protein